MLKAVLYGYKITGLTALYEQNRFISIIILMSNRSTQQKSGSLTMSITLHPPKLTAGCSTIKWRGRKAFNNVCDKQGMCS